MNRRTLLSGVFALASASALAGCATTSAGGLTAANVADIQAIANRFATVLLPVLSTVPGITPTILATVTTAVNDLNSVASQASTALAAPQATSLVGRVEADVNTALGILSGFSAVLPPPLGLILEAASVLLPVIETAVGIVAPVGAAPSTMSLTRARQVLGSAAS